MNFKNQNYLLRTHLKILRAITARTYLLYNILRRSSIFQNMDELSSLLRRVEPESRKNCRLKKVTLFVQYDTENSDSTYLSFQSGVLHVFAGGRFSGKSTFAKYLAENSFCEDYPVNTKILSPFPKYNLLKSNLVPVANQNCVEFIYEDTGQLGTLNSRSIHVMHYTTTYNCRICSKPVSTPNCYLYYFEKAENNDGSVFHIHVLHYNDRVSLVNDLKKHYLQGHLVGKLKMTISNNKVDVVSEK
eukprot:NODE_519_length_7315_cov_0.500554.p2 type:complete len:245 gc:universal NODE_519_length_7315_cov_0.500554:6195-5461(-)